MSCLTAFEVNVVFLLAANLKIPHIPAQPRRESLNWNNIDVKTHQMERGDVKRGKRTGRERREEEEREVRKAEQCARACVRAWGG